MDPRGFPMTLPEFQRVFPDDRACAAYLESLRWADGFACTACGVVGEPYRFTARPGVLRCRACRADVSLTAGTVMQSSHTPLSVWFWAAYLMATQTPGQSATQFQRQLGLSRYETAWQILHKLRAGMVRPERDTIGGEHHVEADETLVGGRTKGEGRGVHHKCYVLGADVAPNPRRQRTMSQSGGTQPESERRRQVVPVRLSAEARAALARMVTQSGTTRSVVVERLILEGAST